MSLTKLKFKIGSCATQGRRDYQEDSHNACELASKGNGESNGSGQQSVLTVLADGMGGHTSGGIASELTCKSFLQACQDHFRDAQAFDHDAFGSAIDTCNANIANAVSETPKLKGMGCTLVGALFSQSGVQWVSIGDSALLLYRQKRLHRLNENHSYGAMFDQQAEAKVISAEEARSSPMRSVLRSAIMGEQIALTEIQSSPLEVLPGDQFILASDGLETLNGNEIAAIIHRVADSGPETIATELISAVEEKGVEHQDNATVVVISAAHIDQDLTIPTRIVVRDDDADESDGIDDTLPLPIGLAPAENAQRSTQRSFHLTPFLLVIFLVAAVATAYVTYTNWQAAHSDSANRDALTDLIKSLTSKMTDPSADNTQSQDLRQVPQEKTSTATQAGASPAGKKDETPAPQKAPTPKPKQGSDGGEPEAASRQDPPDPTELQKQNVNE